MVCTGSSLQTRLHGRWPGLHSWDAGEGQSFLKAAGFLFLSMPRLQRKLSDLVMP